MASLMVEPLDGASFGARITGLDPGAVSETDLTMIWDAYRDGHGLLCFAFERLLDLDELHELTRLFGSPEFAPGMINGVGRRGDAGDDRSVDQQLADLRARGVDPFLTYLGNVDPETNEQRQKDAMFYGEWEWHTDMSYIEVPPTFSLLHSRQIPADGGETGFCDQVRAATELPSELRAAIANARIKHDSTYGSSGLLRPGMTPPDSPIEAIGCFHPVLRRVPSTGEQALFLGRRTNAYVEGLDLPESEALLDALWAHATRPEFSYLHRWSVGQLVVWDNRMLLHKREPFSDTDVRLMWRTQTKGEAVVPV